MVFNCNIKLLEARIPLDKSGRAHLTRNTSVIFGLREYVSKLSVSSNPIGFPEAHPLLPTFPLLFLKSHWGFVSFTYFHTVFQILCLWMDRASMTSVLKCVMRHGCKMKKKYFRWMNIPLIGIHPKILSGLIFLPSSQSFSFVSMVSRSLSLQHLHMVASLHPEKDDLTEQSNIFGTVPLGRANS